MIAYFTHHFHKRGKRVRILPGLGIGGCFALALLVFCEALLYKTAHTSFYTLLGTGSVAPEGVFLAGALQGVIYEFVGSIALGQWYYPTVHHRRKLWLLLPFFWGIFMLIMQDFYAILRAVGLNVDLSIIFTALIPFALIEGINVYTRSWVYQRLFRHLPVLIAGWFLLVYTFVWLFNIYGVNVFGY